MMDKKTIDINQIKLIADICMVIQHMAYRKFFSGTITSYAIALGYIVFPLIVYTLVEGFKRSKNIKKYFLRLFICMIISEIPYRLYFYNSLRIGSWFFENIMATLSLVLLCLYLWDKYKNMFTVTILVTIGAVFLTNIFRTDYGAYSIFLAYVFFFFYKYNFTKYLLFFYLYMTRYSNILVAFIVIGILILYDKSKYIHHEEDKKVLNKKRMFFYLFYPSHFIILNIIKKII